MLANGLNTCLCNRTAGYNVCKRTAVKEDYNLASFWSFMFWKTNLCLISFNVYQVEGSLVERLELMNALVKAMASCLYFSLLEKKTGSFTSYSKNTRHLIPGKGRSWLYYVKRSSVGANAFLFFPLLPLRLGSWDDKMKRHNTQENFELQPCLAVLDFSSRITLKMWWAPRILALIIHRSLSKKGKKRNIWRSWMWDEGHWELEDLRRIRLHLNFSLKKSLNSAVGCQEE